MRRVPNDAGRVIIALGDMPLVRRETLDRLLATPPEGIVVPVMQGRRGHPVLFSRRFFESLTLLSGDAGAAAILRQNPTLVQEVEVDDSGIHIDMDRPEDMAGVS